MRMATSSELSGPGEAFELEFSEASERDIAVVGMAARIADCHDVRAYWRSLLAGRDCLRDLPRERRADAEAYLAHIGVDVGGGVEFRRGGFLDRIDEFDHEYFSLSPKEAKLMSPDQRQLLEVVSEAVEDAGHGGRLALGSNTGLYVGWSGVQDYSRVFELGDASTPEFLITGNSGSIMVGRVAYHFDFKGPAVVVDCACSSSLVAIHLACRAIRSGECEQAIAAGLRLYFLPTRQSLAPGVGLQLIGGIESPGGRSKTFDQSADGVGIGEGVAAVMLRPLTRALADNDHVYAVIKGSATNQDGRSIGRSAPNARAQMQVLRDAWDDARVAPESISYIETHGTGTQLGDPVELKGIAMAFANRYEQAQFCGVGSVKPNIGHLDAASGIAGFIKAVLALHHRTLPPSVGFESPNRKVGFEASPVYVVDTARAWEEPAPLHCGVSAFGMNGSNCHVVLESAPPPLSSLARSETPDVLTLSALRDEALVELVRRYQQWLAEHPSAALGDVCFTANTGRAHLSRRIAIVARSRAELLTVLETLAASELASAARDARVFTNARGLTPDPAPANAVDSLEGLARAYASGGDIDFQSRYRGGDLRRLALPTYPFRRKRCWVEYPPRTVQTDGLPPVSPGTKAASVRGLRCETPDGAVYELGFGGAGDWLLAEHQIAGFAVVPGVALLDALVAAYEPDLATRPLRIHATFLSPCVVEAGSEKQVQLSVRVERDAERFLVASRDASGQWTQHADGSVERLLGVPPQRADFDALRERFREAEVIPTSELQKGRVALGPHWNNYTSVQRLGDEYLVHFSLPEALRESEERYWLHPALMDNALNVLGQLFGSALYLPFSVGQLDVFARIPNEFVSHVRRLSSDQFDRECIRYDVTLLAPDGRVVAEARDYAVKRVNDASTRFFALARGGAAYHSLAFHALPKLAAAPVERPLKALLLSRGEGLGVRLASTLPDALQVSRGASNYAALLRDALEQGVTDILFTRDGARSEDMLSDVAELLETVKVLVGKHQRGSQRLHVVAENAKVVDGSEGGGDPEAAALFAFSRAFEPEYPSLRVRCFDVDPTTPSSELMAEIRAESGPEFVAFRSGSRYAEKLCALDLERSVEDVPVRAGGCYVITGGLGGIGLQVASWLASVAKVKLVLVNRSPFPARDEWSLAVEAENAERREQIGVLRQIEEAGSEVLILQADVADANQLAAALATARQEFGAIHGVVHGAGVAGAGYVAQKDSATLQRVLRPKVQGTLNLERATERDSLDFFVVFSSLASYVGIAGQSDYAAANAFLDGWAERRTALGRPGQAILWPAWSEVGMAVKHGALRRDFVFEPLANEDGALAFQHCLGSRRPRVLVGRINAAYSGDGADAFEIKLPQSLRDELTRRGRGRAERPTPAAVAKRVVAVGQRDPELRQVEDRLAEIWGRLLDLEEIDVHRNFHELGGDSLLATKLFREIDRVWPSTIDIADVFTDATVHQMAKRVDAELRPPVRRSHVADADAELDRILNQLASGELSAEEVTRSAPLASEGN